MVLRRINLSPYSSPVPEYHRFQKYLGKTIKKAQKAANSGINRDIADLADLAFHIGKV